MAVEQNAAPKPQEPDATSLTFGGIVPHDQALPEGSLSLEEPAPEVEKLSLVDKGIGRPALLGEANQQRTAKIQFALGADAPSSEVISHSLSTGDEATLREGAAAQKDAKDQDEKVNLIKQVASKGLPTPEQQQILEQVVRSNVKNDPATVFEKAYARAYTNLVPQIGGADSVVNQAAKKDVNHVAEVADTAEALITKQEIAKGAYETFEAHAKEQGWGGWTVDRLKEFGSFGLYNWYKVNNAATPVPGILKGNNLAEQIQYLYTLPESQMHEALHNTLDKLANDNPQMAAEFAASVVSFSQTNQFLANVGNVADVALLPGIGKVTMTAAQVVKKLATEGVEHTVKQGATVAYQAAVKANASIKTNVADAMAKMGDVEKSAVTNASRRLDTILAKDAVDEQLVPEEIGRRLPSLTNPQSLGEGSSFSALKTQELVGSLEKNAVVAQERIKQLVPVTRTTEEAGEIAVQEAKERLKDQFPHTNNKSVVDMQWEITPAENHPSNVTHVSTFIGDRGGDGFDDLQVAYGWAKAIYKLADKDINIEQRGAKYFIKVTTPVDETTPAVRAALSINTEAQTPQGLAHSFFGWLGTGNTRVSQEQIENRIMAATGSQGLVTVMKDMAKDIGVLSKGERSRLTRIMEDNRSELNPLTNQPGVFHQNFGELERAYQRLFGHSVTDREAKAYFSAIQLNDLDYSMRYWSQYRDRARQGVETFRVLDRSVSKAGDPIYSKSQHFLGKQIDHLPIDAADKNPAMVAIHQQGVDSKVVSLGHLNTPENRQEIQKLVDEGYKVIQTYNPSRTVIDKFGSKPINFIITKDFEKSSLANAPEGLALPYRPGWHQEYEQGWFIKQPRIRKVENEGAAATHFYDGDNTLLSLTTQAEAKKWLPKLEQARQILAGEVKGDLDQFVKAELPMFNNAERFSKLFEPVKDSSGNVTFEGFSRETPFAHTQSGFTTTDMTDYAKALNEKFPNLQDNIRSPWNLMANEQKRFVGQRDAPLWTIKEGKGTEGNPIFSLANAPMIDPMSSLSRGMWDIMRNKYIVDYKTSAVEQWMNEFGHLLTSPVSKEDMWANATTHLHQGSFVRPNADNFNQVMAAMQSRRALLEFIGTKGITANAIDTIKQKTADAIYGIGGQRVSDIVNPWLLSTTTDPMRLMQGFAFHTSFFMNPFQGLQNAMVMSNAIAIGGLKSGFEGFKGGYAFQLMRMNRGEAGLEAAAKVSGWNKQHLKEAYEGFLNTGRYFVEGEHDWKADLAGPAFFQSQAGAVLDKGQIFFREGERTGRTAAWTTAYHEWRSANPSAAFDAAAQAKVLARSDDMTVNMTRASRSAWQQGILSVPTQFWAWNARNMELMVGRWQNGLSVAERGRLLAMNSLLYGVPLGGVAPAISGVTNIWDDVRQYLVDKGWDVNDKAFDALYGGVTGMAYHQMTGRPGNINETLGVGGSNLIKDASSDNKTLFQWIAGVSGTRVADTLATMKPFAHSLYGAIVGGDKQYPITSQDFIDIARNLKIADTGIRTYMALNTGKYMTKNGMYYGDISPMEAWLNVGTNALPRAFTDAKAMQDVTKTREAAIKEATKEIKKNVTAAAQAAIDGNQEMYKVYQTRTRVLCEAADIPFDERLKICTQIADDVMPMSTKIPYEFWRKHAPPSVAEDRFKAWQSNPNTQPVTPGQ